LALGVLSRYATGVGAWPFVFLAPRSANRCAAVGTAIIAAQPARLCETLPDTLVSHQLRRSDLDDICNRWSGFLGISISPLSESKSGCRHDDIWPDHRRSGPGVDFAGRGDCG